MVLYLLGAPSESSDASVGGVAHGMCGADPTTDPSGVCGGVLGVPPTYGIDTAGESSSAASGARPADSTSSIAGP
jgi:hypothetical protein